MINKLSNHNLIIQNEILDQNTQQFLEKSYIKFGQLRKLEIDSIKKEIHELYSSSSILLKFESEAEDYLGNPLIPKVYFALLQKSKPQEFFQDDELYNYNGWFFEPIFDNNSNLIGQILRDRTYASVIESERLNRHPKAIRGSMVKEFNLEAIQIPNPGHLYSGEDVLNRYRTTLSSYYSDDLNIYSAQGRTTQNDLITITTGNTYQYLVNVERRDIMDKINLLKDILQKD